MKNVFLKELAYARSGDKGDVCNIGIMAKSKKIYEFLAKSIIPATVKEHFKGMIKGGVEIYPLPNIDSLQIVLRQSLGGGATCTLRFDQTGKSMCTALLRMELKVDEVLWEEAKAITQAIETKYENYDN